MNENASELRGGVTPEINARKAKSHRKYQTYAILCESSPPFVKFGFGQNVRRRLTCIQTSSPFKMILLGSVTGGRILEKRLHDALIDYRHSGEWFRYEGLAKRAATCIASGDIATLNSITMNGDPDAGYYRNLVRIYGGGHLSHPGSSNCRQPRVTACGT